MNNDLLFWIAGKKKKIGALRCKNMIFFQYKIWVYTVENYKKQKRKTRTSSITCLCTYRETNMAVIVILKKSKKKPIWSKMVDK